MDIDESRYEVVPACVLHQRSAWHPDLTRPAHSGDTVSLNHDDGIRKGRTAIAIDKRHPANDKRARRVSIWLSGNATGRGDNHETYS